MSFGAPWMFAALAAVAVVVWFHLRAKRYRTVDFPATALLSQIARRRTPHLRLRRLLILLFRILAVMSIVLAMTLPSLTVVRAGGIRSGSALAQVIVLDDSASTSQKTPDDQPVFSEIRRMAETELRRLRSGDTSAVVLMGTPARPLQEKPTQDIDAAVQSLATLKPGYRANALDEAIDIAEQMLAQTRAPQKEILVITDMCGPGPGRPFQDRQPVNLRMLNAAPQEPPFNLSVSDLRVTPSGENDPLETLITATVVNHTDAPVENVELILFLDGREAARGTLDIGASASAQKTFHHRFSEEGIHRGAVSIPRDGLVADNTRYVSFRVRRALRLHVINGDVRPGSWEDEAFYLMKALATPMPAEQPIQITMTDVSSAGETPTGEFDAIFMTGVNRPPAALVERLTAYVAEGGGLFISPGASRSAFEEFGGLLPGTIRSVRRSESRRRNYRIGTIDREHPLFSGIRDAYTGLEDVRIASHLMIEPNPAIERKVLMSLSDGVPLLLERTLGRGRVILLGTTVNRAWGDLPIRPGYLLLMQRLARYLGNAGEDRSPRQREAGQTMQLEVNERTQRLVVVHPDDSETAFAARDLANRSHVIFDRTEEPGIYRVWAQMTGSGGLTELPGAEFVVNMAREESDLIRRTADVEASADKSELYAMVAGRLPLWPWLLMIAVLALLCESLVAGWFLRRSHARRIRTA